MSSENENFAYSGMLVELSQFLGNDELDSMKYMCKSFIKKRELETLTTFLKFCSALESHDKLSETNLVFLKLLLEKCCNGKKDGIKVVQKYELEQATGMPNGMQGVAPIQMGSHVLVPTQMPGQYAVPMMVPGAVHYALPGGGAQNPAPLKVIEKEVSYLTRKLGREWRFFMRSLGVSDFDMTNAEQTYPRSLRDQIYSSFATWAAQEKGIISKNMLVKALRDPSVERFDLAANIEEGYFQ